jgi:hypothetical protein
MSREMTMTTPTPPRKPSVGGDSGFYSPLRTTEGSLTARWAPIWFNALRYSWSTLALVPAEPGLSAFTVGDALSAVGKLHRQSPVPVLNAQGLRLSETRAFTESMTTAVREQGVAITVVDSPLQSESAIAIVAAADAAILVVRLGAVRFASARRTVELIGRDRFLGTIVLRP